MTKEEIKNIDSKHYDFLWTVGGYHPFFISSWLSDEYLKRDFIYTYKDDIWTLFVSKDQRKTLANEGLHLFLHGFDDYKERAEKQIKDMDVFFETKKALKVDKLDTDEFTALLRDCMERVKDLWKTYFWVEYHNFDELARIIQENDTKYNVAGLKSLLQEGGVLKFKIRQCLNKSFYPPSALDSIYHELPHRLNLPIEKINLYHYEEVLSLLKGKKVEIQDRSKSVCGKFSDWKYIVGEEVDEIISKLSYVSIDTNEIKGNVGNKGNYIGKVKKIDFSLKTNFQHEISVMNKGDVLVSGSTGPEMILACRKAGAIVTDEGGIISHAAIVSRELNIPSVIGTKIATRVLKDGDLVEVDANKGIVKIIKRAEKVVSEVRPQTSREV